MEGVHEGVHEGVRGGQRGLRGLRLGGKEVAK